jgi:predicted N-acetyltransferase YhbS
MSSELLLQQLTASDEVQFSELMDRCFNVPGGQHYLEDFPIWRGTQSDILKMGAYDGATLVGAAAVRMAEITAPASVISVGLIGAVATDEKYRGRGIAKKLVSLATDWAQNRGAVMAALWGSEHELYAKIGFMPCGRQVRVALSAMRGALPTEKVHTEWNPAIFKMLQQRKSGVELKEVDRIWFSAQKNVKWFWTGSSDRPNAYAALGRGIDLPHMVHEWGGSPQALFPLLSEIVRVDPLAQILGSPETFARVGIQYDPSAIEFLCLARVLNPLAVFRAFVPTSRVPVFNVKSEGGFCVFEVGDGFGKTSELTLSLQAIPQLFFGPKQAGVPALKKPFSEVFPLPLWFWGLDAV